MSSNFSHSPPLTSELAALEGLKIDDSTFTQLLYIDPILFKLAGKKDMHNFLDEFKFRPD